MIGPLLLSLLDRQEKITIPGLGTFSATNSAAALQFAERTLLPPSRKIEFKFDSNNSNFSILPIVAQEFHISEKNAELIISHISELANSDLNRKGFFEMDGFGGLVKDLGGEIHFKAHPGILYNAEAFGLPLLSAASVESAIRAEVQRETPIIPLRPFDSEEKINYPRKKEKKTGFQWIPYAAVVAALAVSFSAILYVSDQNNLEIAEESNQFAQEASIVQVPSLEKELKPKSIQMKALKAEITETKTVIAQPEKEIERPERTYFVVAGSFKEAKKWEKLHSKLSYKGFESDVITNSENGFTRVTIGKFQDKESAINFLHSSQNQFDERLWVLTQ